MIGAPKIGPLTEAAASSPTNVDYPAGIAAGDVAIIFTSASSPNPVSPPFGWTPVVQMARGAGTLQPSMSVFMRKLTGSEVGPVNIDTGNVVSLGRMFAVSGVDLTTPIDGAVSTFDSGSDGTGRTITVPAITTTVPNALVVSCVATAAAGHTYSAPSTLGVWTEWAERTAGTRSCESAYLLWSGSGSTGAITTTVSGTGGKLGALFALRPAQEVSVDTGHWGIPL